MIPTRTDRRTLLAMLSALPLAGCMTDMPTRGALSMDGGVTRLDPRLNAIIPPGAAVEVIATGYRWTEGPVWNAADRSLLFSDVPANVVHRWTARDGASPFLTPSGLTGPIPSTIREAGANGLAIDRSGRLVMGDSGSRTVARVDLTTRVKAVLAERFDGKRFNSPNDVAIARDGAIFFTDPPYGLEGGNDSAVRELRFNGVYRLDPNGRVTLLDDGLSYPNGIALSPDERTLYVAVSDPARPELLAYTLDGSAVVGRPRLVRDFRDGVAAGLPGLPDGLKVDAQGNLFASGPGGIHVLAPDGTPLGLVATGRATANCALAPGWLYLTASDRVARIRRAPG